MRLIPSSLLGKVNADWVPELREFLNHNMGWIITCLTMGMIVYGVYLGVEIARADSSDKAQAAKKRLVHFLIGIVIAGFVLGLFYYFLGVIETMYPPGGTTPS